MHHRHFKLHLLQILCYFRCILLQTCTMTIKSYLSSAWFISLCFPFIISESRLISLKSLSPKPFWKSATHVIQECSNIKINLKSRKHEFHSFYTVIQKKLHSHRMHNKLLNEAEPKKAIGHWNSAQRNEALLRALSRWRWGGEYEWWAKSYCSWGKGKIQ